MKLAVNYSRELQSLHDSGQVKFDIYKCPDWQDMIETASKTKPVYVHFPLCAGDGSLRETDWTMIDQIRQATQTPFINLHLCAPKDLNPGDHPRVQQTICNAVDDVQMLVNRYGKDTVIIENMPVLSSGTDYLIPMAHTSVINQVVTETGCQFLFDIAHARLTTMNLGWDWLTYIRNLPLERLREFHITGIGPQPSDGILVDHLELDNSDWKNLSWCFDRIRSGEWSEPALVSFEYGGIGEIFRWRTETRVLLEQVPRLYALVHPG